MLTSIPCLHVSKATKSLSKKRVKVNKKNYMTKRSKIWKEEEEIQEKALVSPMQICTDNEKQLILSDKERNVKMRDCEK